MTKENFLFQLMRNKVPVTCQFLGLDHHVHSPWKKSIIERKIHYIKDRTESFDDYFLFEIKELQNKSRVKLDEPVCYIS